MGSLGIFIASLIVVLLQFALKTFITVQPDPEPVEGRRRASTGSDRTVLIWNAKWN